MIENSDAEQIERLNSRIIELLRERDALVKALGEILKMADGAYASTWLSIPGAWDRINDMRLVARAALASLKEPS